MVAGHSCVGGPSEIIVQHLSQRTIGYPNIRESLVEAGNGATIHFVVFAVAAVDFDDRGFVTMLVAISSWAAKCLGPIRSQPLRVLRVKAMAKGMCDYIIGHHPAMPGVGKLAQSVHSSSGFENALHAVHDGNLMLRLQDNLGRPGGPPFGFFLDTHERGCPILALLICY